MLTADLVRARRRGGRLYVQTLEGPQRQAALVLAERYLAIARASVGSTRGSFEEACAGVALDGPHQRLAAGLLKLVTDRCLFEPMPGIDPQELRRQVFGLAGEHRRASVAGASFERDHVLDEIASQRGLDKGELERLLYADLRTAHALLAFEDIPAADLLEAYDLHQVQAVLLRAVRVEVEVLCRSPLTFRRLLRQIKFLRLLFTAERLGEGRYFFSIDGPFSLFQQVTRYGLGLALLVPYLRACDAWELRADLLWGRDRAPLSFQLAGETDPDSALKAPSDDGSDLLGDEAASLLERFQKAGTAWQGAPCVELFHLPGVGLCIPDLVFHKAGSPSVYLEILGYWSRQAVWKRVELVEQGLPEPILFAVSSRLRVSEAALDADGSGALYVYKGVMNPAVVADKLDRLASNARSTT